MHCPECEKEIITFDLDERTHIATFGCGHTAQYHTIEYSRGYSKKGGVDNMIQGYAHNNSRGKRFYLHTKEITLKTSNRKQRIFWFALKSGEHAVADLPAGYQVVESRKSGLPVLKKVN